MNDSLTSPVLISPMVVGEIKFSNGPTQTTVGSAGGATALPATPSGYLRMQIGGTEYVLPFYAVA